MAKDPTPDVASSQISLPNNERIVRAWLKVGGCMSLCQADAAIVYTVPSALRDERGDDIPVDDGGWVDGWKGGWVDGAVAS